MSENAKQSPRTLVVNIKKDLSAELLRGGNKIATARSTTPAR
jgi:hypothetical protein